MTSTIKVDNIQNQCGANIINESSNTITIGASGDTVSLASGASQTGFGRTGTVDWQTTKKTASFTAVNGEGYFVDTSSSAITMTLPASPSAGDIVAVKDYAFTFGTNALTIGRNGSNIGGAGDFNPEFNTNGAFLTFIYVDSTKGWLITDDSTNTTSAEDTFVTATGGTITTCGDFKIHTFTGPGTFCVSAGAGPKSIVDYMVVAGGGSGGPSTHAAGGGAGGFRESKNPSYAPSWTSSPLVSTSSIPVTVQGYPVTIGSGGTAPPTSSTAGTKGSCSVFSTITSAGGGGAGAGPPSSPLVPESNGGSGGGSRSICATSYKGSGNTPPVSPPQGNDGGATPGSPNGPGYGAGGGGGATAAGGAGIPNGAGNGGAGATTCISGSPTAYAGGGGGSLYNPTGGAGGSGGTGGGGAGGRRCGSNAVSGTANTGGGGGGAERSTPSSNGGNGGSGIVIIRYKFQ